VLRELVIEAFDNEAVDNVFAAELERRNHGASSGGGCPQRLGV
jgi:hypothetical protein